MTTSSNGINLEGFDNTNLGMKNNIDANYSPATGSFPSAADKSAQGNAGLNQEGSSASLPLSGPDTSDNIRVGM
jgi:hypothetical protein